MAFPLLGTHLLDSLLAPLRESWTALPATLSVINMIKQTHLDSPEIEVRSKHSCTQGNENMPKLVLEAAEPSSKPQEEEPTSPPSSPTKATTYPDDGNVVGTLKGTGDQDSLSNNNHSGASSDMDASRENMADSQHGVSIWGLQHMFRHR